MLALMGIYSFFVLYSLVPLGIAKLVFIVGYSALLLGAFFATYKVYQGLSHGNVFRSTSLNFYIGFVFTIFVTLLVLCVLLLLQDGGRLFAGFGQGVIRTIKGEPRVGGYFPSRRNFLTLAATGIASIPFFSMLYGVTKGKYNFEVNRIKLAFRDLPKSFNGFKIVQISDIHAGSLDSVEDVARAVGMINDEKPNIIAFTGDLVNSKKDEINPFIETFSNLEATHGKFAILGNHDYYGLHSLAESEHEGYWADFYSKFKQMGFNLLNNASSTIEKDGETIKLLGVENWGKGRYFPKKGNLDKALQGIADNDFSILMSHDPSHWDEKVIPNKKHMHLTMSGHTHGMQFGISMPGFKWSPIQYRYPRWMGLYEEAGQYLYVNKGFGFLGFPGRVGMWPEITVIELKSV